MCFFLFDDLLCLPDESFFGILCFHVTGSMALDQITGLLCLRLAVQRAKACRAWTLDLLWPENGAPTLGEFWGGALSVWGHGEVKCLEGTVTQAR